MIQKGFIYHDYGVIKLIINVIIDELTKSFGYSLKIASVFNSETMFYKSIMKMLLYYLFFVKDITHA